MRKKLIYWMLVRIPFWFVLISILVVTILKWMPIRYTPLMIKRAYQFRSIESYSTKQRWIPIEECAPELIMAVIASEDNRFFQHHGFDWEELLIMWEGHKKTGIPIRGCSTISQQTAKNVFTFASNTWIRKAFESWWTILIEFIWGKRRIMEVYINVVEMGKGIYGIEEASWYYFGINANKLDFHYATSLALCLPLPLQLTPYVVDETLRQRCIQVMTQIPKLDYPEWVKSPNSADF